eukprot:10651888-Karenia_brevis.AAC.1
MGSWAVGHRWFAAGGSGNRHGIGLLLRKRWASNVDSFRPVSQRVRSLDLDLHGTPLKFVSVYMPHC